MNNGIDFTSADSNLHPSKAEILFGALFRFIPESWLWVVEYLPTRQFVRFREYLVEGKRLGRLLLEERFASNLSSGKDGRKSHDILSILGNLTENLVEQ
jgi:hypothetical protein